jgi:hypothetical protein
VIYVGMVLETRSFDRPPLLYYRSRYGAFESD